MGLLDARGRIEPGSSILFEGRELTTLSERELRGVRGNEISMIFQEPMTSLNPVFRVGDQIAEAVRLHQDVSSKEAMQRRAGDARARRHPRGRRAGCATTRTSSRAACASA